MHLLVVVEITNPKLSQVWTHADKGLEISSNATSVFQLYHGLYSYFICKTFDRSFILIAIFSSL